MAFAAFYRASWPDNFFAEGDEERPPGQFLLFAAFIGPPGPITLFARSAGRGFLPFSWMKWCEMLIIRKRDGAEMRG